MKLFTLIEALLSLLLATPGDPPPEKKKAVPAEVSDLSGIYLCRGQQPSGKEYTGAAMLRQIGDVYHVQWSVGGAVTGIGVRTGDRLSVGWVNEAEGVRGVTVYQIQPGPRLVGRWASIPGSGRQYAESLEFLKDFPREDEP